MVNDTCLDSPLAAAQSLVLQDLEGYRRSQHLNNNDWKQAINKNSTQNMSQRLNK
jgi:hypothetical protein